MDQVHGHTLGLGLESLDLMVFEDSARDHAECIWPKTTLGLAEPDAPPAMGSAASVRPQFLGDVDMEVAQVPTQASIPGASPSQKDDTFKVKRVFAYNAEEWQARFGSR